MKISLTRYASAALLISSLFVAGSASAAVSCPVLTRSLQYNSRGADVTLLQTYLAQDSAIYPEGVISGFFGRATEKAVQRFQAAHGIVSAGTPATTGYGAVGGKTRAALAACKQAATTASTTLPTATSTTHSTLPTTAPLTAVDPLVTVADGATTTITRGTGTIPSIGIFSFNPRTVELVNDPVTMFWTSSNALNCSVQKLNGSTYESVNDNVGVNGSVSLKVAASPTIYSLYCVGIGDNSSSSPASVRRDVTATIANLPPTCTITPDKSSYTYSRDTIKLSWTSTGADAISWSHGAIGSDAVPLPYGNQYPSGSIFLSSTAGQSQTVTLNVSGRGGSATCSASFSIVSAS